MVGLKVGETRAQAGGNDTLVFFKVEPSQPLNPRHCLPGLITPSPASSPGAIVPSRASFLHIHLPLFPLLQVAGEETEEAMHPYFLTKFP